MKDNGERGRSRRGEPSDHHASLTLEKREGRKEAQVGSGLRHSAALRKSLPGRRGAPEERRPIREVLRQAEWPRSGGPVVLSHWVGTAWAKWGLSRNAAADPKGKMQQLGAVS